MSDPTIGMPKCIYCGTYHNYSAEMCKDLLTRPRDAKLENRVDGLADRIMTHVENGLDRALAAAEPIIRADERARIREGAVDKIAKYLADRRYWTFDAVTERSIPQDCLFDAARIVYIVLRVET